MIQLVNNALANAWPSIISSVNLKTPDNSKGKDFSIVSTHDSCIEIKTEGNSTIRITRQAFIEALLYLVRNNHDSRKPCEIQSNDDRNKSGPLCLATRDVNSNTRVITYILPILANVGIVGIDGTTRNKTWLV
jgi:hypothetical protein